MSIFSGIVKTILGIIKQAVAAVTEIITEVEAPPIVPQPPPAPTAGSQPVSASKPSTTPSPPQPPALPDISATPDYGAFPGTFVDLGEIMDGMAFERAAEDEGVSEDLIHSIQIMRLHEPGLLTAVVGAAKSAKDALTSLFAAAGSEITEETARLLLAQQQLRDCSCYPPGSNARLQCEQGNPDYPPCTLVQPTAPPTLIPTNTPSHPPGPVIIPTITPVPSPSPTSDWTVPMQDAYFSDIDYTTREECTTDECLPSQDINRRVPGEYPVLAPAEGEIMIIDTGIGVGENASRGNFVAIRIPVDNIPPEVAARSPNIGQQGFLYIGYAHLSQIDVSVGDTVSSGQQLGISGRTGLPETNDYQPHLDLAMFFIPTDLTPSDYGSGYQYDHNTFNASAYQEAYYPPGTTLPLDVKPSDIWPELITYPEG